MKEIWHIISINNNDFDGRYIISNFGRVFNTKLNIEMSSKFHKNTKFVSIKYKNENYNINIKRKVAEYFLPNPNNYKFVLHKDKDKTNCHVNNLVWSPSHFYTPNELIEQKEINKNKKEKQNKLSTQKIKEMRKNNKLLALQYKGNICSVCGYNKCISALEFHHLNPEEKDFNFSRKPILNWEILKQELDKCILVCSNCHKEIESLKHTTPNNEEILISQDKDIKENWKPLIIKDNNFNQRYLISNFGNLFDKKLNKEKKAHLSSHGHKIIEIEFNKKKYSLALHIAVANHFLDNPMNCSHVIFLNKDKQNCKVSNLAWSNSRHSIILDSKEERDKKKNVRGVILSRKRKKIKAVEYKGGQCQVCGYHKNVEALEFHHINPEEKDFQIGNFLTKPWAIIQKELDKCVLVCSNCHREIHDGITPCPEPLHKDLE